MPKHTNMMKRTTISLEDDVYAKVVELSLKKYGTAKAISKVINEMLRKAFREEEKLLRLIYSEKTAEVSEEDFFKFRRELSKRAEA